MTEPGGLARRLPWPPLIYLGAIAISILLGVFYPLPWLYDASGDVTLEGVLPPLGALLIAAAAALWFTAIRAMRAARTPIHPGADPLHLVTAGPFGITRNPIYLGNTILMIGLALVTGNVWFIPLAFIAAFLTAKVAIEGEEKRLASRFGKKYHDYAKRVRRWL